MNLNQTGYEVFTALIELALKINPPGERCRHTNSKHSNMFQLNFQYLVCRQLKTALIKVEQSQNSNKYQVLCAGKLSVILLLKMFYWIKAFEITN